MESFPPKYQFSFNFFLKEQKTILLMFSSAFLDIYPELPTFQDSQQGYSDAVSRNVHEVHSDTQYRDTCIAEQ